ncbi:hypothetical protein GCM10009836_43680 [Pseudonocardia ailaonensis]|uniref:Uncharacterized protein n=1 Tax=Pseudonocardia ailaonensis TaxID=367279 RepID=A0ABN2N9A8_9PSEU
MEAVGVLIFFSIVGAFLCAKARFSGGAVAFSLVALVLFVATPAGQGLPGAVGSFLSTLNHTTTPVLTDAGAKG